MSEESGLTCEFDRFSITMPERAVEDCSHSGECARDTEYWAPLIARPTECTPDALRTELREYGAWDEEQLADDAANWERILWIAAGNIREESRA